MFEQYETERETPSLTEDPKGIFENYEIKSWVFSPRLYKILAGSAIANLLVLAIIGQTNMLTMRGCDSPFVGRVCQVLDTVYVGTMLFGTDRDFIDAEYERIDLGDSEVVWIDRTGDSAPFEYPEGYFQLANPEQFVSDDLAMNNPTLNYTSPTPYSPRGSSVLDRKPKLPKPNNDAVVGDLPDSPFATEDDDDTPTVGNLRNGRRKPPANAKPTPEKEDNTDETVAGTDTNTNGQNPNTNPTVSGLDINKRPLVDLANQVNELREKENVDLQGAFIVKASGKIDKTGRLDPRSFKFERAEGDAKLVGLVEESIEAINVAGYLQYLKDLSGRNLDLLFVQDEESISATIMSEMESETRARSLKTLLDLGISTAKSKKISEGADQNDKDDLLLLEGAKIVVDGKKLIILFNVEKELVHPMIQRKLAETANDAKKPNGNAAFRQSDNRAAR
ncbi:MAG: hypothetical protein KF685_05800 [Acidobacteria bacterium]|nr:hypothetical protein [Acidobacteriota bacterium]